MMSKIAMIYSTTDGQTKLILDFLKTDLAQSHEVELSPILSSKHLDLDNFDKIVLGASVRYGKHKPEVYRFVESKRKILEQKETFFFSVNVVARKIEKSTPATNPYMLKFLKKSNWQPKHVEVFAGRVIYPDYNFVNRNIIRFIMYLTKGPTDITRSYEFTDWESVKRFGSKISQI